MSTTPDYGGPAFPYSMPETERYSACTYSGMSLRDWLAGQAPLHDISQMIPNKIEDMEKALGLEPGTYVPHEHYMPFIVTLRWRWADAMLSARNPKSTPQERPHA